MVTLYHIAAMNSGLVVGTGNKVEDFGVGFYTKYGDGGVDVSPIADLTKSEVRQLAKDLGVNQEIVTAKPTDGLWDDGRTDEDQIGASYEELEWVMEYLESGSNYSLTDRQKDVLDIFYKFHNANMHKMISIPIFKK
jgi:NAD+ synthase